MVLLGTIVNGVAIIVGSVFGKVLHKIPENIKVTVMQGIGLAVVVLGMQMGLKSQQFIIPIISLVIGGILGERWDLEQRLKSFGEWIESKMGGNHEGEIAKGFVAATLLYIIGAMAILGALDSGLRNDHSILYTKSIIDGFTSVILTSTLGIGVIFSALPVILYQGAIALFATQIDRWVPMTLMNSFIVEMTATGGIMIIAIGLNMLGLLKVRVANLLPSILVVAVVVSILYGAKMI